MKKPKKAISKRITFTKEWYFKGGNENEETVKSEGMMCGPLRGRQ